jgi:hypothetical protein
MRGISVWIFSKIVMLIFLFLVFGTVISFVRMTNERVAADAADSLTMQLRSGVQTALNSPALSAKIIVPLPKTLPESGVETAMMKKYTVAVSQSQQGNAKLLSIAIAWDIHATLPANTVYVAASSMSISSGVTVKPSGQLVADSDSRHYFVITKASSSSGTSLCLQACRVVLPSTSDCVPQAC